MQRWNVPQDVLYTCGLLRIIGVCESERDGEPSGPGDLHFRIARAVNDGDISW